MKTDLQWKAWRWRAELDAILRLLGLDLIDRYWRCRAWEQLECERAAEFRR